MRSEQEIRAMFDAIDVARTPRTTMLGHVLSWPDPPAGVDWSDWAPEVAEWPILALRWVLRKETDLDAMAKAVEDELLPFGLINYMKYLDMLAVGPDGRFTDSAGAKCSMDVLRWVLAGDAE